MTDTTDSHGTSIRPGAPPDPEVVLFDMRSPTLKVCFVSTILTVRCLLNYKKVRYHTVFMEYHEAEKKLRHIGRGNPVPSSAPRSRLVLPALHHIPTAQLIIGAPAIIHFLQRQYPDPPLAPSDPELREQWMQAYYPISDQFVISRELLHLSHKSARLIRIHREQELGFPLERLLREDEAVWLEAGQELREFGDELKRRHHRRRYLFSGDHPSLFEFAAAAEMHQLRLFSPEAFERLKGYPGFWNVYLAVEEFTKGRT